MPTSGSTDYNNTRDQIITLSYQLLQQYSPSETVATNDITFANVILNQMVKMWQAFSGLTWKRDFCYLITDSNVVQYSLGNASGDDNCTEAYITTVLTADQVLTATTCSVNDVTGMSVSDFVVLTRDDGTLYRTTIASVNTGTNVITLTAAPGSTSDTISSGNRVFTYTTKVARPLKLSSGFRRQYAQGDVTNTFTDVPIKKIAMYDYSRKPNKYQQSTPLEFFYQRSITSGKCYVYPASDQTNNTVLGFVYDAAIQDLDSSSDNPDFPQEWLMPLAYNLAVHMAPSYGFTTEDLDALKSQADEMRELVLGYQADDEAFQNYPDPTGR